MKWFKHMSGASRDEKIVALEGEFGLLGYARYFKLLETISEQMDETDKCEVAWRPWKWCQALGYSRRDHALSFLQALAKHDLCCISAEGELWSIKAPKLLKIRARQNLIVHKTRHTEVEEEVEIDKEEEGKKKKTISKPIGLSPLALKWNEICVSFPKVVSFSKSRKIKEQARLRDVGVERLVEAMKRLEKSDFCKGSNQRGWKATYDWLISNDAIALKVLEGTYEAKKEVSWKDQFLQEGAK